MKPLSAHVLAAKSRQRFAPQTTHRDFIIAVYPQFLSRAFPRLGKKKFACYTLLEPHTNLPHNPQRLQHRMDATARWRPTSSGLRTSPGAKVHLPPERLHIVPGSASKTKEPASPTTSQIAATSPTRRLCCPPISPGEPIWPGVRTAPYSGMQWNTPALAKIP